MVLLEAAHRALGDAPVDLHALHVHHGLSPNADAWAQFCREQAERRGMAVRVLRVHVAAERGDSVEAAAREARYDALAEAGAATILLAHHADDQAETLILQLARGAGPHGLAAMPERWTRHETTFLRPLLAFDRAAIESYAQAHALRWIDDESNADPRFRRNALRHRAMPVLAQTFPGLSHTLARAARHQAEAAELLDTLARNDALPLLVDEGALDRTGFAALHARSPVRAKNVLRWFLREHGLPSPSEARASAFLRQCIGARADRRVRLMHAGATIGVHRGRIVIHRTPAAIPYGCAWNAEEALPLPGGVLRTRPDVGCGLAATALHAGTFTVRPRQGGEYLLVAPARPRQSLTRLFQAAGTPWWQRDAWPTLWCGDALAAVPGIAVDARFAAAADAPGFALAWEPRS